MLIDDLEPANPLKKPKLLDTMSLDELAAYVEALKAEITRVEAAASAKKAHMHAVSSLFKTPG